MPSGGAIPPETLNGQILAGVDVSTDYFETLGGVEDVIDLPDDRRTAWTEEQRAKVAEYRERRKQLWYRQVHETAARVPISALTADDIRTAMGLVMNALNRSACPMTRGQILKIEAVREATEDALEAQEIITGILGAFTFGIYNALETGIGGSIARAETDGKASTQREVIELYNQGIANAGQVIGGSADDLRIDSRVVLDRLSAAEQDALYEQRVENPTAFEEFYDTQAAWEFGSEPIMVDGAPVYARRHLFDPDRQGAGTWAKGWLSAELACTGSIAERVVRRARVYRACDAIGAALRPYRISVIVGKPDADGVININAPGAVVYRVPRGLYAYRVGGAELWGCVLPPHPADQAVDLVASQPAVFRLDDMTKVASPLEAEPTKARAATPVVDTQYAAQQAASTSTTSKSAPAGPPSKANTPLPQPVAPLGSIVPSPAPPTANVSPITLSRLSLYRGT